jgi:small-conductance mechanosensitive channel
MGVELPPIAAPQLSQPITVRGEEATSVDERWAAWQAKGAAQDRVVRRKLAIAAPILLIVVAVVFYALIGR